MPSVVADVAAMLRLGVLRSRSSVYRMNVSSKKRSEDEGAESCIALLDNVSVVAFADGKCAVVIDMLLTFPKNFVCRL